MGGHGWYYPGNGWLADITTNGFIELGGSVALPGFKGSLKNWRFYPNVKIGTQDVQECMKAANCDKD